MQLVNLQSVIPDILIDLRYATLDNFTGTKIYEFQECFLLKETAEKLARAQEEFKEQGLQLKVWDGFRPIAAQWKFWELLPDERYVADPKKGGRHTRGTAVDVTLATKEGLEVPMPSAFDDFSVKALRNYEEASEEALYYRQLLQDVMEKHGFIGLPTEWWHFDFIGWQDFPPIDWAPTKTLLSH